MLRYIDKVPCITVGDMFAFGLASGRKLEQPEFYNDYNVLWKRYRKNTDLWKDLCGILSSHAKNNDDVIAKFDRSALLNDSDIKDCTYIIPYVCSSAVNKIVEKLKEIRCIGENSRIVGYTTDSCKVLIENRYDNSDEYEKLFSNVYVLQNADAVDVVEKKENNSVQVLFDNLVVKNVQIPTERFDSMLELIRFFEDKKYVMNLRVNKSEKTLSFTYATRQIKHLLTVEGSILEVYTYHKVKETGYFDDVVCNYEVSENGDEDAKNELDCVMTKGFNTVFVKCKARRNTEPSFYYKLLNLKAEFGINAKTVLIDDTAETKNYLKETANKDSGEMQGDRLNIITISNYEEIQNIGQVLSDIANGTYGKKQNIE
jgi:hypothetical protein